MKNTIFALLILITFSSFAGAGGNAGGSGRGKDLVNLSWAQIFNDPDLQVQAPAISFFDGVTYNYISVLETCLNGNQIETIQRKPIYEEKDVGGDRTVTIIIDQNFWEKSADQELNTLIAGNSIALRATESAEGTISYPVAIHETKSIKRFFGKSFAIAKKDYPLPACQDVR